MDELEIAFRDLKKEDHSYIYATWLRSYKDESVFAQWVPKTIFYNWHPKIIQNILGRPYVHGFVINAKDDPDIILGYLITEHQPNKMNMIHFVYIKKRFREFGLARKLVQHAMPDLKQQACEFTHCTFDTDSFFRKHPEFRDVLIYNPYGI